MSDALPAAEETPMLDEAVAYIAAQLSPVSEYPYDVEIIMHVDCAQPRFLTPNFVPKPAHGRNKRGWPWPR